MDWNEIWKWAIGIFAAVVAAGFVLKIVVVRKSSTTKSDRKVTQSRNRAGRDIIGGDSIDNSKR